MTTVVEFAGPGARVKIEVVEYENPDAQDPFDANWLRCRVEVGVSGFEGRVLAAFTTHDFTAFSRSLRSAVYALQGGASFETDEDALRLTVEFGTRGNVTISGVLSEGTPSNGASLTFSFESDQTFLRPAIDALDVVNRKFPVRA